MAELRKTLDRLRSGVGGCLVIEGDPGIGKSRLIAACVEEARDSGLAVAVSRATLLDRLLPLAALRELLAVLEEFGLDTSELSTPDRNPMSLVCTIEAALEAWAGGKPAVIALDDVQWMDELTSLVLRNVVPKSTLECPVLWLLARRPTQACGYAQASVDYLLRQDAEVHRLQPLHREATVEMCAELVGAEPGPDLVRLALRCDGNPFLLEELLNTSRNAGQLRMEDGKAILADDGLPTGFVNAVEQHLSCVSGEVRRMLSTASVLGRAFTVHEVSALTGRSVPEVLPHTVEAIQTAILVADGASLTFRHDLIREALYDGLPAPVRSALHREAAGVVQREGRSPVEATEHLIRSGHAGPEGATELLRQAVEHVAPTAPNTAADMIIRMLGVLGKDTAQTPLVAEAVRLLATAGRVSEAIDLAESRLNSALDDAEEAALLLGLSEALYVTGRNLSVIEYTDRALAKPNIPDCARADLLAIRAWALIARNELDSADEVAATAIEHGVRGRSDPARSCGTAARGVVLRSTGHLDEALALGTEAVRIADDAGGEALHRHTRLWLSRTLAAADDFAFADTVCDRGLREADRLGTYWSQPFYQLIRAELRLAAGRLDDASAEAKAGLQLAEQANTVAPTVLLLALLGELSIHGTELDRAADYLRRANRLLVTEDVIAFDGLSWALAQLHEAKGQPDVALDTLRHTYATHARRCGLLVHQPGAAPRLVSLAQRVGQPSIADDVVSAARRLASDNPRSCSFNGVAWHAEGLRTGDVDSLHHAVRELRTSPRPLALAAAQEDLALFEISAGRDAEAVTLMEEARELYRTCGSRRGEARTCAWLGEQGADSGPAEDAPHPDPEWRSLTQSEIRVVRLVAEGLTNREVASRLHLSPHTVDSHLRHSFAKLAVTSRVQLARKVLASDGGQRD